VKYKKELLESYQYFGNYNILITNYSDAIANYEKALSLDPENASFKETIDYIKNTLMKNKK
jgi:tetratricopeptide (TPR) repeat protein